MMQYQAARYLVGILLFFVAGSLLVPLVYALWWGEPTVPAFTVTVGLCLGVGWLLRHRATAIPQEVTTREGVFAVVAVWLGGSFVGAMPFWLSGGIPHVVDAWFETVSGLTTTGASILTNFGLYYRLLTGHGRLVWRNTEWRVFIVLLSVATLLITGNLLRAGVYQSLPQALRDAAFQTVSISTTTGFATADFATWPPFSQTLLLLLMFTGACLGSTSGALRLGRLILLGKLVTHRLRRIVYPRQVEILVMDELPVESDTIPYITNYFVLYLGIAGAASLLLTLCELDLVTSVSAVAATLGGVGPGLDLVGPMSNFATLPVLAKLLLIGCMLVGRLDLYTPLVVCLPTFWRP